MIWETRIPLPVTPGRPARYDYEYERRGVCARFMLNERLRGWREVVVGNQRTAIDWAHVVKHLLDVHYPAAEQIVLVMDNLNTRRSYHENPLGAGAEFIAHRQWCTGVPQIELW